MAIGSIVKGSTALTNNTPNGSYPGSVLSDWVNVHDSLAATAATSTVLKTLLTNASANTHYCRVPAGATRCLVRARYSIGATAFSTQPLVKLYSIFDTQYDKNTGTEAAPAFANDGTVRWMRIDAATIAAAGFQLTVAPSTDSLDTTYGYGDPYDLTGFDLKGGAYLGMLVSQAAVVSGGAGTVWGQVLFLN